MRWATSSIECECIRGCWAISSKRFRSFQSSPASTYWCINAPVHVCGFSTSASRICIYKYMCLSEVDLSVRILRGVVDLGIGPCYLSLSAKESLFLSLTRQSLALFKLLCGSSQHIPPPWPPEPPRVKPLCENKNTLRADNALWQEAKHIRGLSI